MDLPMTNGPCTRCLDLAREQRLRVEAVQRLPEGAFAPQARDGSGKCCLDCAAADALVPKPVPTFEMARIAVANERQEQYRMPGVPMGLVKAGLVRPSAKGDFENQLAWLDSLGWFGLETEEET